MYTICHHVVVTEAIQEEWKRHRSRMANRWLNQMLGRKKVDRVAAAVDARLQRAVQTLAQSQRECALKDLHIVMAALATDGVVLSCDDRARAAFSQLTTPPDLNRLLWANPDRDPAGVLEWLRRDAPTEAQFRLHT